MLYNCFKHIKHLFSFPSFISFYFDDFSSKISLRLQEIVNLFPGWKSKSFGGLELGMGSKNGGEMEFLVLLCPMPLKKKYWICFSFLIVTFCKSELKRTESGHDYSPPSKFRFLNRFLSCIG